MNTRDMKPMGVFSTHGRTITKVFDCDQGWKEYRTKTKIPASKFLMNYDLKFGGRTVLLLDDYGNDFMPEEVEKLLVGEDFAGEWLLGIDLASGELLRFVFYRVKKELITCFARFEANLKVPKKFLTEKNLKYIRSCKRPWNLHWEHSSWLAIWNRYMTWNDFCASVIVRLELFPRQKSRKGRTYLDVWGDTHRTITAWS